MNKVFFSLQTRLLDKGEVFYVKQNNIKNVFPFLQQRGTKQASTRIKEWAFTTFRLNEVLDDTIRPQTCNTYIKSIK